MGSKPIHIPVTKAAELLDCEPAKVHELADQGLVRRTFEGDTALVRREDIEEVYRLQLVGELRPGELVRRLLFAEQKIIRLEGAVNLLYEINQLAGSRFSLMEDAELHSIYSSVIDALGETHLEREMMVEFGEIFLRITEVEIDRLNELAQIDHAWKPFYRLCLKLSREVGVSRKLDKDLELQRIRDLLHQGRRNLQTIAILFIEQKAQLGPSRELLAKMAAADIESFDALAKQMVSAAYTGGKLSLTR